MPAVTERLGVDERRYGAGLVAHYNTWGDVERLLAVVSDLARQCVIPFPLYQIVGWPDTYATFRGHDKMARQPLGVSLQNNLDHLYAIGCALFM